MKQISKIIACLLFFIGFMSQGYAQFEENRYEFWREDAKITNDMFYGDSLSMSMDKYREYNFKSVISIGFWSALDVPQKKKDWKIKEEQYYFCAAVDKTESCLLEQSEMGLKHAQVLWDICELATREARKSLSNIVNKMDSIGFHTKMTPIGIKVYKHDTQNRIKSTGLISMFYMTAVNDGKEFGKDLTTDFVRDVVIAKNDSMYYEYRKTIDNMLNTTKEYATSEQEIKRLMTDTPPQGYIPAPHIFGDRKNRGTIEY